jgi:hypothetical protein
VRVRPEVAHLLQAQTIKNMVDPIRKEWWKPPEEAHLVIDDEIKRLLRRKRAPRIDADTLEKPYSRFGPFHLARLALLEPV